ncbi:ABC transporter permease [candidate division KSB1 bacterium]|nr:ABC transporter permease [candidate division KSB1 bacterium]
MFKNYLKISFRNLWRAKGYSAINLAGLATGMACFILILLWVQDELSYDKFHENTNRLFRVVRLDRDDPSQGVCQAGAPWGPALYNDFPEVENFVRFRGHGRTLMSRGDKGFYESEGLYADSTIFEVFTFPLLKGNPKTALTRPNTMVINERMAEKYFGSEDPVGQSLVFNNQDEFEITGIMQNIPANSHIKFDYLIPFFMYQRWDTSEWGVNNFYTYLLLAEGTATQLEAKIPEFLERHAGERTAAASINKLQPITDIHLHSNLLRELEANGDIANVYIFSAIAIFILLIACINFMNLATARSANRAKEVGIRKVVGSQRLQLIKQFLGESIFLSIIGILLAVGLVELLIPNFNELSGKQLSLDFGNNVFLLTGLLFMALIVGFISGAYPAFFLSSFKPIAAIKGDVGSGKSSSILRKGLVILQFAISITLIVGTAVVYRQLNYMSSKKLGFDREQVLVIRMDNSEIKSKQELFRNELLRNPAISGVSATSNLLGGGDWGMPFSYEGSGDENRFSARVLVVDPNFVETLGMQIVDGRNFSNEFTTDISAAYILNESAVKQIGFDNPVGKYFGRPTERNEQGEWDYEKGSVVGVIKDFHFRSFHEEIQPMVLFMIPEWFSYLSVRIRPENISTTIDFVEKKWHEFDPNRPFDYFFLDEIFDQMYRAEQRFGNTFVAFSVIAVVIACLGLFGLASFMAERRTKEIGIRKVLGASIINIVSQLSKDFTKWVIFANLIAWPVAFFVMNKWLQNFAYQVGMSLDTFLLAGVLALLIALLTVSFHAIKAAISNPVDALRHE